MNEDFSFTCPICHGNSFKTEPKKICRDCRARTRTRAMALAIKQIPVNVNNKPVYHFAPEQALQEYLIKIYGNSYIPADFSPELYSDWSKVPVQKVDLSEPLLYLPKNGVYGLIHSHVLEHIPCSIDKAISEMNDSIISGGFHLLCVPIHNGWYREDMDPDMPAQQRDEAFYQHDHLRVFGDMDFQERLLRLFQKEFIRVDLSKAIDRNTAIKAAIPKGIFSDNTGTTPFLFIKL